MTARLDHFIVVASGDGMGGFGGFMTALIGGLVVVCILLPLAGLALLWLRNR